MSRSGTKYLQFRLIINVTQLGAVYPLCVAIPEGSRENILFPLKKPVQFLCTGFSVIKEK